MIQRIGHRIFSSAKSDWPLRREEKILCRAKAYGMIVGTAFAVITLLQFAAIHNFQAHAGEGSFDDFPYLVHCEIRGAHHAYYLSKIGPDGVAVYMTPDRKAGTISIRGKAEPVGGIRLGNCVGKTLEQLRSAGQAYDLKR